MSNTDIKLPDDYGTFLTEKELDYQTLRVGGMPAYLAFEKVFGNDPLWAEFFDELPSKSSERKATLRWAAREIDRKPAMIALRSKINERVIDLAPLALDTLEELMVEGKSEKVRGDVAIEILRQNVGSPDKSSDNNVNVKVVFGSDPSDIIEGEVIDDSRL